MSTIIVCTARPTLRFHVEDFNGERVVVRFAGAQPRTFTLQQLHAAGYRVARIKEEASSDAGTRLKAQDL